MKNKLLFAVTFLFIFTVAVTATDIPKDVVQAYLNGLVKPQITKSFTLTSNGEIIPGATKEVILYQGMLYPAKEVMKLAQQFKNANSNNSIPTKEIAKKPTVTSFKNNFNKQKQSLDSLFKRLKAIIAQKQRLINQIKQQIASREIQTTQQAKQIAKNISTLKGKELINYLRNLRKRQKNVQKTAIKSPLVKKIVKTATNEVQKKGKVNLKTILTQQKSLIAKLKKDDLTRKNLTQLLKDKYALRRKLKLYIRRYYSMRLRSFNPKAIRSYIKNKKLLKAEIANLSKQLIAIDSQIRIQRNNLLKNAKGFRDLIKKQTSKDINNFKKQLAISTKKQLELVNKEIKETRAEINKIRKEFINPLYKKQYKELVALLPKAKIPSFKFKFFGKKVKVSSPLISKSLLSTLKYAPPQETQKAIDMLKKHVNKINALNKRVRELKKELLKETIKGKFSFKKLFSFFKNKKNRKKIKKLSKEIAKLTKEIKNEYKALKKDTKFISKDLARVAQKRKKVLYGLLKTKYAKLMALKKREKVLLAKNNPKELLKIFKQKQLPFLPSINNFSAFSKSKFRNPTRIKKTIYPMILPTNSSSLGSFPVFR